MGDTLLAWVSPGDGTGYHLERPDDLGGSWEPVELPHAPGGLRHHQTWEAGDRVVVIASTSDVWAASGGYIWTSDHGVTWLGGPVTAVPPDDPVGPPTPLPGGRLAIALHRPDQPQALVTADDGASWQLTDGPAPWVTDAGCDPPPIFDRDGSNPRRVASTQEEGVYYGQPVATTGTVVIPELDHTGAATLVRLHP